MRKHACIGDGMPMMTSIKSLESCEKGECHVTKCFDDSISIAGKFTGNSLEVWCWTTHSWSISWSLSWNSHIPLTFICYNKDLMFPNSAQQDLVAPDKYTTIQL